MISPKRLSCLLLFIGTNGCFLFEKGTFTEPESLEGELVWQKAELSSASIPWLGPGVVYMLSSQHEVHALEQETGALRWTTKLPVNRSLNVGFSGVRAATGIVYVGDERLFALREGDGSILWEYASPVAIDVGRDTPVLWRDLVFLASSNGYVIAVDATTGRERWSTTLVDAAPRVGTWVSPVVGNRLIVGITDFRVGQPKGHVAALDTETGRVLWQRPLPHQVTAASPTATFDPLAIDDVVAANSSDGPVYGFDIATGIQLWKVPALQTTPPTPDSLLRDDRQLARCGAELIVASSSQVIIAVDPASGVERRRLRMRWGSPTGISCDDSTLFAVAFGGQLEAFALGGARVWELGNIPRFVSSVTPNGRFVFGGGPTGIFAVRARKTS